MRKFWIGFLVSVVLLIAGVYIWTNTAYSRLSQEIALTMEEIEKMNAIDSNRASLFTQIDLSDGVALSANDPFDAMLYYKEAQNDAKGLKDEQLSAIIQWVEDLIPPTDPSQAMQLLEIYSGPLAKLEKGLMQRQCSIWSSPSTGLAFDGPHFKTTRFLSYLLLLRAMKAEEKEAFDKAAIDFLRVAAYTQDLSRFTTIANRLFFARIHITAIRRLQTLVCQKSLNSEALGRILAALTTLEQIEPPLSQSIDFEELLQAVSIQQSLANTERFGGMDRFLGIFNFSATHDFTDAIFKLKEFMKSVKEVINLDPSDALPGKQKIDGALMSRLLELENTLHNSDNSWLSGMGLNLQVLKIIATDIKRHRRITQIAAAVQLYRHSKRDFPENLQLVRNEIFKTLPEDPYTNQPFTYQLPDTGVPKLEAELLSVSPAIELDIYPIALGLLESFSSGNTPSAPVEEEPQ